MDTGKMNKLVNKMADAPFKFGKNDCYTFTSKLVKEWHGIDHVKRHAVYKSEEEAQAYMDKNGGIEALTIGTLGYAVDPETCTNGDVVSAEVGSGVALGFVFNGVGLFKAERKIVKIPLRKCRLGWRLS